MWLATQNHSTLVTERSAVPFLPVNPEYSATRNQVRGDRRPGCLFSPLFLGALFSFSQRWAGTQASSPEASLPQGLSGNGCSYSLALVGISSSSCLKPVLAWATLPTSQMVLGCEWMG